MSKKEPDQILKETAEKLAVRIKCAPYEIYSSYNVKDNIDIILIAGDPVKIIVSHLFILDCITTNRGDRLRGRIKAALEVSLEVHKTLANYSIVGYRESLAMMKDAKKWIKNANPDAYIYKISNQFFKKTYTITIEDTITNITVTVSGKNLNKIEDEAHRKLIHMIEADQESEELRQALLMKNQPVVKVEEQLTEIHILGKDKIEKKNVFVQIPKIVNDDDGNETLILEDYPVIEKNIIRDNNFMKTEYIYGEREEIIEEIKEVENLVDELDELDYISLEEKEENEETEELK